jgi:hypothetical protein
MVVGIRCVLHLFCLGVGRRCGSDDPFSLGAPKYDGAAPKPISVQRKLVDSEAILKKRWIMDCVSGRRKTKNRNRLLSYDG